MKAESRLVRQIIDAVKKRCPDAYVRKLNDRTSRGIPDLIIAFETTNSGTVYLWVEVKTPEGRLSKIQEEEHAAIRRVDGIVLVVTDVAAVIREMDRWGATSL